MVSREANFFFLIDDIWPIPSRPQGFLLELGGLLQGSPDSRIAISTRNTAIAIKTGSHVDLDVRDPKGRVAVDIFMSHANPDEDFCDDHVEFARGILDHCERLTISSYRPRREGLQAVINVLQSEQDYRYVSCADYSVCERYFVAGLQNDISLMSIETREHLGCFKGHDDTVLALMFSKDASKIVSECVDGSIMVWDW